MQQRGFEVVSQFRPFGLVAPGFEQVAAGPATVPATVRSGAVPVAPYAAVEVELAGEVGPGGAFAGLRTADGAGVVVGYEPARRQLQVIRTEGGRDRVLRRRRVRGDRVRRLAFVLTENQVTGLVDTGDGWIPVVAERDRVAASLDLRDPERLALHTYAWGPLTADAGPLQVAAVRAGTFGMVGLRDLHAVQHTDGRPYDRDGRVLLTATCAGPGAFRAAHWGVFALDLAAPDRLNQVGQLFSRRDGLVLGDHAGQVVVDDDRGECRVAVTSWGDFSPRTGVHVWHATADVSVLAGEHVLDTEPLDLPTPRSTWDPAATVIDGRWHVAYVDSPSQDPFNFRPALAVGPVGAGWGERLEPVGVDTSLEQCEGPILTRLDGAWRLLASDGRHRCYPVYDLAMRRVGELDAPYVSNIPHPQLVPLPAGSALGRELLLTFDGTPWGRPRLEYGTHGDVVVMAR